MIWHQNIWRNCKLTYPLHLGNQPLLMMRQNKQVYVAIKFIVSLHFDVLQWLVIITHFLQTLNSKITRGYAI